MRRCVVFRLARTIGQTVGGLKRCKATAPRVKVKSFDFLRPVNDHIVEVAQDQTVTRSLHREKQLETTSFIAFSSVRLSVCLFVCKQKA